MKLDNESLCFILGVELYHKLEETYGSDNIYRILECIEDELFNDVRYIRTIKAKEAFQRLLTVKSEVKRYGEDGEIIDMDDYPSLDVFRMNANYDFRSVFIIDEYGSILTSTGTDYKLESTVSKGYLRPGARFRILEKLGLEVSPCYQDTFTIYIDYLNKTLRNQEDRRE